MIDNDNTFMFYLGDIKIPHDILKVTHTHKSLFTSIRFYTILYPVKNYYLQNHTKIFFFRKMNV